MYVNEHLSAPQCAKVSRLKTEKDSPDIVEKLMIV